MFLHDLCFFFFLPFFAKQKFLHDLCKVFLDIAIFYSSQIAIYRDKIITTQIKVVMDIYFHHELSPRPILQKDYNENVKCSYQFPSLSTVCNVLKLLLRLDLHIDYTGMKLILTTSLYKIKGVTLTLYLYQPVRIHLSMKHKQQPTTWRMVTSTNLQSHFTRALYVQFFFFTQMTDH